MNDIDKIKKVIDDIRPYIIKDGGNINFEKYEDNIVYISLEGNCTNCSMIDTTLNDVILLAITEEVPTVLEIQVLNTNS